LLLNGHYFVHTYAVFCLILIVKPCDCKTIREWEKVAANSAPKIYRIYRLTHIVSFKSESDD